MYRVRFFLPSNVHTYHSIDCHIAFAEGRALNYRSADAWANLFEAHGTSHPSRGTPRKLRNDGRPPDTVRQLIGKDAATIRSSPNKKARVISPSSSRAQSRSPSKRRASSKTPSKARSPVKSAMRNSERAAEVDDSMVPSPLELVEVGKNERTTTAKPSKTDLVSYPLYINSCWLDTTLEVLYRSLVRNVKDLQMLCTTLHLESPLRLVVQHLSDRHSAFGLKLDNSDVSELAESLTSTRNILRRQLFTKGVTRPMYDLDELWVSCMTIFDVSPFLTRGNVEHCTELARGRQQSRQTQLYS